MMTLPREFVSELLWDFLWNAYENSRDTEDAKAVLQEIMERTGVKQEFHEQLLEIMSGYDDGGRY